jgi:undecaprenyl diphosphate synthase
MDGNNRYSKKNNIKLYDSYKLGAEKLLKISKNLFENYKVNTVSAFGLSHNNTKRPKILINTLKNVFEHFLDRDDFNEYPYEIIFKGDLSFFPKKTLDKLKKFKKKSIISKKKLLIYLNYSGQIDIIKAAINYNDRNINFVKFKKLLTTNFAPEPDILIRTGGFSRISDFFLFDLAFTDLFFIKKLWPDFSISDLDKIISKYMKTERKFGY